MMKRIYLKTALVVSLNILLAHATHAQDDPNLFMDVATMLNVHPPTTLGSTTDDLVFTPVTPCRIVDTRLTLEGKILGSTARSFHAHGADLSAQGGGNCDNPNFDPGGIAFNVTVTGPVGPGFATVYPEGEPLPPTSSVNFTAGADVANAAAVKTTIGAVAPGFDFEVYASQTTHVIVDLIGYYAAPERTTLETSRVANGTILANNAQIFGLESAPCPTGTRIISGACHPGKAGVWIINQYPNLAANVWRCGFHNQSGGDATVYVYGVCANIPGR